MTQQADGHRRGLQEDTDTETAWQQGGRDLELGGQDLELRGQGLELGTCVLYNEPFADYLANCERLSGPPDVSGCSVDSPEESSCDGVR